MRMTLLGVRKPLTDSIVLPLLSNVIPTGLVYGANYIVEFQPHSLWYEASLTLVAQALRKGQAAEYHTFQHPPEEVRRSFSEMGLDYERLEREGLLRIQDSYTVATGLDSSARSQLATRKADKFHPLEDTMDLKVWSDKVAEAIREGAPESIKRRLHVDENTSVLLQYNDEKAFLDAWRTRALPITRENKAATVHSLVSDAYSDSFYKQLEALCEGIIDFESREEDGEMRHYMRVRLIRGKPHDSRWHKLQLLGGGEVRVETSPAKKRELGVGDWLRGTKRSS